MNENSEEGICQCFTVWLIGHLLKACLVCVSFNQIKVVFYKSVTHINSYYALYN